MSDIGIQRTTRAIAIAVVDRLFNARSEMLYDVAEQAVMQELDIEHMSGGEFFAVVVQARTIPTPTGTQGEVD